MSETTMRPCRYRARAWLGDELVAESSRAVRVEAAGKAPELRFPVEDVRRDVGGVFRRVDAPADHVAVDHERARVELVDAVDGDDERDVTIKRFPNWGDASDLIDVLDRGVVVPDTRRPVVEASQLLGQLVVAAMRGAPGRRVVSAHLVALRVADANQPLELALEPLSSGRTFTAFRGEALQGERRCASATLLLGVLGADVVRHDERAEGVPGPYDAVPHDMGVTGRDLRVVDAAYTVGSSRVDLQACKLEYSIVSPK